MYQIGNAYKLYRFWNNYEKSSGFLWMDALMSDEIYNGLASNCDYSTLNLSSKVCLGFVDKSND